MLYDCVSVTSSKDPRVCTESPSVPSIMKTDGNQQEVEVLLDDKSDFTYRGSQMPSNPTVYVSSDGDSPYHVNCWPVNNNLCMLLFCLVGV